MIDESKWEAVRLPDAFTAADAVVLMAIESGLSMQPWQFDYLAGFFAEES